MSKTLIYTTGCKLDVDGHDAALTATQRAFNAAAAWIARVCWDDGITNTNTAHHRVMTFDDENRSSRATADVCEVAITEEADSAQQGRGAMGKRIQQGSGPAGAAGANQQPSDGP
jgi:hypothetical protein